jgi:mono/diheme cytochrome c family protein
MFDQPLARERLSRLPKLAALEDSHASEADRVRSYLDANCAQCHRPGGVRGEFDARYETPLAQQKLMGGKLVAADLGVPRATVVTPGDRSRSMLYLRMQRRQDVFNMPPLATHQIDAEALELIGRWIDGL